MFSKDSKISKQASIPTLVNFHTLLPVTLQTDVDQISLTGLNQIAFCECVTTPQDTKETLMSKPHLVKYPNSLRSVHHNNADNKFLEPLQASYHWNTTMTYTAPIPFVHIEKQTGSGRQFARQNPDLHATEARNKAAPGTRSADSMTRTVYFHLYHSSSYLEHWSEWQWEK
jgi:hypothetical protein